MPAPSPSTSLSLLGRAPARALVVAAAVAFPLGLAAAVRAPQQAGAEPAPLGTAPVLEALSSASRELAASIRPSVVQVEVRARVDRGRRPRADELFESPWSPFGPRGEEPAPDDDARRYDLPPASGTGSGWVYRADGLVVTNHHVVRGAERIRVRFADGATHAAELVAADPATDVALLRVPDAGRLEPIALASDPARQGDVVFAFGSPLDQAFSMSMGVVSGVERRMGILGPTGYESFIQTDAAINPGNSGGPLVDIRGRVVGMNTAIASPTGFFSGLGFAVPASMIRPVVEELLEHGEVRRGWLGAVVQDEPELLRSFGYEGEAVLLGDVLPDGPADRAGLRRGDVVLAIEGERTESVRELRALVAAAEPGETLALRVFRDGDERTVEVELGRAPTDGLAEAAAPRADGDPDPDRVLRELGVEAAAPTEDEAGVLLQRVRASSVAAEAGLVPGDVVLEVGDAAVGTPLELARELGRASLRDGVRLTVRSGEARRFVLLRLPE